MRACFICTIIVYNIYTNILVLTCSYTTIGYILYNMFNPPEFCRLSN